MKTKVIEYRKGDECSVAVIQFTDGTEEDHSIIDVTLVIEGFGTAPGTVRSYGTHPTVRLGELMGTALNEQQGHEPWLHVVDFGHALVWAEPITFAFAVRDLILNG